MSDKRIAVYGGSFDPPTLGHTNILAQAVEMFDRVYVVVAANSMKQPWIPPIDRCSMWLNIIKEAGYGNRVVIHEFGAHINLFRSAYHDLHARWAIRGIRGPRDLEDERDLRAANAALTPQVTPVYLLAPPELAHISSSMVRAIVQPKLEGWEQDLKKFVPPVVRYFLRVKFGSPGEARRAQEGLD